MPRLSHEHWDNGNQPNFQGPWGESYRGGQLARAALSVSYAKEAVTTPAVRANYAHSLASTAFTLLAEATMMAHPDERTHPPRLRRVVSDSESAAPEFHPDNLRATAKHLFELIDSEWAERIGVDPSELIEGDPATPEEARLQLQFVAESLEHAMAAHDDSRP